MPGPITPFNPVNQVTPFTYRDNDTYLTLLSRIQAQLEGLDGAYRDDLKNLSDYVNKAVDTLVKDTNADLTKMRAQLIDLLSKGVFAWDPTHGNVDNNMTRVLSNIYDYVRVYAYFASEIDAMGLTAAEYDALGLTARFHDLQWAYPTIHAVNTVPAPANP